MPLLIGLQELIRSWRENGRAQPPRCWRGLIKPAAALGEEARASHPRAEPCPRWLSAVPATARGGRAGRRRKGRGWPGKDSLLTTGRGVRRCVEEVRARVRAGGPASGGRLVSSPRGPGRLSPARRHQSSRGHPDQLLWQAASWAALGRWRWHRNGHLAWPA